LLYLFFAHSALIRQQKALPPHFSQVAAQLQLADFRSLETDKTMQ